MLVMKTLHGYEDHPGFGGRIAANEHARKRHSRFAWVLLSAILALAGGGILLWLELRWT